MFYPADPGEGVADGRFRHMDEMNKDQKEAKTERMDTSNMDNTDKEARLGNDNAGRATNLAKAPVLKDVVEDPRGVESCVKLTTSQSSFVVDDDADDISTLILASAETQVVEELKQAVATSRKRLHLHVLDFIPPKSLEYSDDGARTLEIKRVV
jgi:hypothetical protein